LPYQLRDDHGEDVRAPETDLTASGFNRRHTRVQDFLRQRTIIDRARDLLEKNLSSGDDPAVVAKVIVAAATDRNPKLRRTTGTTARIITAMYRIAPARIFDRVIRRFNRMPS
jgi:hypothetical protein